MKKLNNLNETNRYETQSPFHKGEKAIQSRIGLSDDIEAIGRRVIRSFMPEQHQVFFSQLPFIVMGGIDDQGWPWASILADKPGFISSPTSTSLHIGALVQTDNPLNQSIKPNAPIGLLGIELATRRRNRLNGRIAQVNGTGFTLSVDQTMGNCPKYIQAREIEISHRSEVNNNSDPELTKATTFTSLDKPAQEFIAKADTFFVASYAQQENSSPVEGVDVSHRGGHPGFVKVEGNTLTIPDYSGNNVFMTLGNFLVNPKAGLVFVDFDSGDLLMLTGRVEILWEDNPEVLAFKGAQRAWRFVLDHGVQLKKTLPFKFIFKGASPSNLTTGDWQSAEPPYSSHNKPNTWQPLQVTKIEDETPAIRSFYLSPIDNKETTVFKAGQHLPIKLKIPNDIPKHMIIRDASTGIESEGSSSVDTTKTAIRTYTLSSPPNHPFYRISVKREPNGPVSNHLHDNIKVGDIIEAKQPQGSFYIDTEATRPLVLIAGGVGITPMVSMAQYIAEENTKQVDKPHRKMTIIHSTRLEEELAFSRDFYQLAMEQPDNIHYQTYISGSVSDTLHVSEHQQKRGPSYSNKGRITADGLRSILSLDDYDFYLCGPSGFMQAQYENLKSLGVPDKRIHSEAFGPSTLTRQPTDDKTSNNSNNKPVSPKKAKINFSQSKKIETWTNKDNSLLDFAEAQGLTPEFSCRNGSCGTCKIPLKSGSVSYKIEPTIDYNDNEVVLCCAIPANEGETIELDL